MSNKKKDEAKDLQDLPDIQTEQPEVTEVIEPEEVITQEQTTEETRENDELRDKYLRLAAEYDNFRKRAAREREMVFAGAKTDVTLAFLPVYDNLERALSAETADLSFKKGVEMTMRQLRDILAKLGIEEIPALNETFDPNFHNAVMHTQEEGAGQSVITEVFQTGFKMGDRVIRPSMVKVVN